MHAFSVDVEDWYQGIPISAASKAAAAPRLDKGLDPLLEMLAAARVRGTFFVLGPLVERHAASIKRIADAGHEIGCHGWSHDLLYGSRRDSRTRIVRRATELPILSTPGHCDSAANFGDAASLRSNLRSWVLYDSSISR